MQLHSSGDLVNMHDMHCSVTVVQPSDALAHLHDVQCLTTHLNWLILYKLLMLLVLWSIQLSHFPGKSHPYLMSNRLISALANIQQKKKKQVRGLVELVGLWCGYQILYSSKM